LIMVDILSTVSTSLILSGVAGVSLFTPIIAMLHFTKKNNAHLRLDLESVLGLGGILIALILSFLTGFILAISLVIVNIILCVLTAKWCFETQQYEEIKKYGPIRSPPGYIIKWKNGSIGPYLSFLNWLLIGIGVIIAIFTSYPQVTGF